MTGSHPLTLTPPLGRNGLVGDLHLALAHGELIFLHGPVRGAIVVGDVKGKAQGLGSFPSVLQNWSMLGPAIFTATRAMTPPVI